MNIRLSSLVTAVVACISLSQFAHADAQCSKWSLILPSASQEWDRFRSGVKMAACNMTPFLTSGSPRMTGRGKVTVSVRVQFQGKTSPFSFAGTYDLSASCAGTATFKDGDGNVALVWEFVLVDGGDSMETMALRSPSQTRPMYSLTFTQEQR